MAILQLQTDILKVIIEIMFWSSLAFIPVVSTYWPWWKHVYGKAAISIDGLLTLALLPAIIRQMLDIPITQVEYNWFTIVVFALIPARTVWLAMALFAVQKSIDPDAKNLLVVWYLRWRRRRSGGKHALPRSPEPTEPTEPAESQ